MYQVDELIDHIRELEGKQVTHVFILSVYGTNSSGDAFQWKPQVAIDITAFGKTKSEVLEKVCKDLYEGGYLEYINDCCRGDEECCGSPMPYEEYKDAYLDIYEPSQNKESIDWPDHIKYGCWLGNIHDSHDEVHLEAMITCAELIDH